MSKKRCAKHEPELVGDIFDQLSGFVKCKNCGMRGQYSNGNRRTGRPRRVIWFRRQPIPPTNQGGGRSNASVEIDE